MFDQGSRPLLAFPEGGFHGLSLADLLVQAARNRPDAAAPEATARYRGAVIEPKVRTPAHLADHPGKLVREDDRTLVWQGEISAGLLADLRSQQPRANILEQGGDEVPETKPTPHDVVERQEERELAGRAMRRLNHEDRRFMRAWYLDGHDGQELARQLGVAVATVYSRRFKIVAKLARSVEELERPAGRGLN